MACLRHHSLLLACCCNTPSSIVPRLLLLHTVAAAWLRWWAARLTCAITERLLACLPGLGSSGSSSCGGSVRLWLLLLRWPRSICSHALLLLLLAKLRLCLLWSLWLLLLLHWRRRHVGCSRQLPLALLCRRQLMQQPAVCCPL